MGLSIEAVSAHNGNFSITARLNGHVRQRPLNVMLISARFSNHPWGTGNFIHKVLEELGHNVVNIDFKRDIHEVENLFKKPADILLSNIASGITPRLLEMKPCPAVLWYPDDILTQTHAQRDLVCSGYAYDYVYCSDMAGLETLKQMGIQHSAFLPLATDPTVYSYIPEAKKKYEIALLGTVCPNNRDICDRLKQRFNIIETTGTLENIVRILNESKIALNLSVGKTGYPLSVYEALGCRCFVLTNEIDERHRLFKDRAHLVYFNDETIEELIRYYLDHEEERDAVAASGYLEVCAKHTFKNRVTQILSDFGLTAKPGHNLP